METEQPKPSTTEDLFGESDESSSDEENFEPDAPTSRVTKIDEPTPTKADDLTMDHSEDEDEPEFDQDQAEVQGRAAPKITSQQLSENIEPAEPTVPMLSGFRRAPLKHWARPFDDIERQMMEQKILPPFQKRPPTNSSNVDIHTTKLPPVIAVQSQCFNPETYDAAMEQDLLEQTDPSNVIRWRYKMDEYGNRIRNNVTGMLERESNARLIRYNDGTMSLQIGAESYEVQSYPSKNNYVYLAHGSTMVENVDGTTSKDTVAECMSHQIHSKLLARPSSLQSAAHKRLTLAVRQKHLKMARMKEIATVVDPEAEKAKKMRAKMDILKDRARRGGVGRYGGGGRRPGMNKRYLDEDDDMYETTGIKNMKNRVLGGANYSEEEESSDDGDERGYGRRWGGKLNRDGASDKYNKKRYRAAQEESYGEDESEENELFEAESDDEEDIVAKRSSKKVKKAFESDSE